MPENLSFRTLKVTTVSGTARTERTYQITYLDDLPERREAVAFFNSPGVGDKKAYRGGLFPDMGVPPQVETMSPEAAQAYLDSHPMQQRWRSLTVTYQDMVFDDDLARLQYLPEITTVKILSSRITNQGVRHLRFLTGLKHLVIYSRRLTNGCLRDIALMKSLEVVDMQMCPWVTRSAFSAACAQLPNLKESFPPRRRPVTAIIRWFYTEWRMQRRSARKAQQTTSGGRDENTK